MRRWWILLLILASSLTLQPGTNMIVAQDGEEIATVLAWRLNVRAAPTTDAAVLGVASYGEAYALLGANEAGDWLQIRFGDAPGWIAARYAEISIGAASVIETVTVPTGTSVRTTQGVNLRAGPGTNFEILNGLAENTQVEAIGRSGDNRWVQVQLSSGRTGWVIAGALPDALDISALPMPQSALIAALAQGAPWQLANTVPVRMGPGVFYPIVGYINAGSNVQIIGRDTLSQWVKIAYPISNGWIPANGFPADTAIDVLPLSLG